MRDPRWPELLAEQIEAARDKPFEWGKNDCALWAADVVLALTGVDHAANLRGKYKTPLGAKRRINAAGDMRSLVPLPEKPVGLAQRGDLVLAVSGGLETFGIVSGAGYWCAPGPYGLVFRPMAEAQTAFEV